MYHFVATCPPEPLDLSEKVQIPGHIRQYLKDFQIEALRFLHSHLANRDFCILNDESGLGKCVAAAVYLGAISKSKNCLIIVQNDDELVTGWQFHFQVLTHLSVGVLGSNISLDPLPNVVIAKWATLRSTVDGSKYNFDYIIVDNRGQMMNNNFCMSMLLSNYEHKVNLLISSFDVTADLKLLHNSLRLGGHLEHQYEQFKLFEAKYKLPDSKDVLNKTADLEQYFLKREMISDYCKGFRLRRYRHQFADQLPLVDIERYKISLELWHTISSSNSSQKSNENANNLNGNSETATEELFNQALALDREISGIVEAGQSQSANFENNESSDDAMSPLLVDSESCSSNEPEEVVDLEILQTTKKTQKKLTEPDVYEFVDLSHEQGSEEYASTAKKLNECHSTQRSLTKETNNQKTTETMENIQKDVQKVVNTKDLTGSQMNRKKTKIQDFKDTLEKKTIAENGESKDNTKNNITNVNIVNNKNSTASKGHIQNKSVKKHGDISKKEKLPDLQAETETENIQLRRRGRTIEINLKDTSQKLKKIDQENDSTIACQTLNKRQAKFKEKQKLSKKDIEPPKKKNVAEEKQDKTGNEKCKVEREKKSEVTKSKQDIIETPKRTLRTLRDDKIVSPVRSATTPASIPAKTSPNKNEVDHKKSSKDSATCDTEKQNRKGRPKKIPRIESPRTPTVRNTRRMQRLTRSSDSSKSKYMISPLSLENSRKAKKRKAGQTENRVMVGAKEKLRDENKTNSSEKRKSNTVELEQEVGGKTKKNENTNVKRQKLISTAEVGVNITESVILPCSDTTDDMQCGQKVIADTHSDNGFLRPPTPTRLIRNSEQKIFLPTPSSFTDSEVVFVPQSDTRNKNQQVVILSSSTDDGSVSSQQSVHSRRTRVLKQKKVSKRLTTDRARLAELSATTTPTFGELLAKQRVQRKSPDIFTASTDLGLTCTQQPPGDGNYGEEIFQGFKIFGSEVKQMQQQNAIDSSRKQNKTKQVLSRGRSCLNILEKMFDTHTTDNTETTANDNTQRKQTKKLQQTSKQKPDGKLVKRMTRGSQPVVPSLPNNASTATAATTTQLQQTEDQRDRTKPKQKENQKQNTTNQILSDPMVDEEIFEITNNDAFGSMMRINSNGEISPVQMAIRSQQQPTQHNKITNYLIGSTQLTPTEVTLEERTPSKRTQIQLSGTTARRSPKNRSTQSTKLTKWFQKNDVTLNNTHLHLEQNETRFRKHTRSGIAKRLKRRCLELSFQN